MKNRIEEAVETFNETPNAYSYSAVESAARKIVFLFTLVAAFAYIAVSQS